VDRGTKVLKKGVPELIAAVEEGRMSVTSAADLAEADPETQRAAAKEAKFSVGHARKVLYPGRGNYKFLIFPRPVGY
jgi:hypothetical protein